MPVPSGTAYYVPITVNNSYVYEDLSNYPYQIDMSDKLASDSTFKSHISTVSNIAVYDPTGDTVCPKIAKLDLPNNKLLIYFDGSTDSSNNKVYWVCVGSSVNESNSVNAMSNSNYTSFWGFDEFTSGSTTVDDIGGYDGTVTSPATIGNTGIFGNCANNTGTGDGFISTTRSIPTGEMSFEMIVRVDGYGGSSNGRVFESSGGATLYVRSGPDFRFNSRYDSSPVDFSFSFSTYYHLLISRDASDNVTVYRNGSSVATGNSSSPVVGSNLAILNRNAADREFDGNLDNFGIISTTKTINYANTRYNMLINDSSFWTIGTGQAISPSSLPSGTAYYVPITVDNTYIAESLSNFPYQIDLSSKLSSDSTFKGNISSSSNISVYDPISDSVRPRIVELDLTEDLLLISFDSSTSTTGTKTYYVCVGSGISDSDSPLALSNSGYTNRWGLNEDTGATTVYDSVGSNNGTGSSSYLGVDGGFGKCISYPGSLISTRINCGDVSVFNSASEFTVEFIIKVDSSSTSYDGYVITNRQNSTSSGFFVYYHGYDLAAFVLNGGSGEGNINVSDITLGQWNHIAIVYDGSQATNADRLKIYVDGSPKTVSFTGTIPSSLSDLSAYPFSIGDDPNDTYHVFRGTLDEVGIISSPASQNFLEIRSNQFLESSFWTIGSGQSPSTSGSLKLFSSGNWNNILNSQIFIGDSWRQISHKSVYLEGQWKDIV